MTIIAAIVYGSAWIGTGLAIFVIGRRAERKRLLNPANHKPSIRITPNSNIILEDLRGWLAEHGVDLHQPEPPTIDVSDLAPHHQPLAHAQSFIDDALDHYPVDSIENELLVGCIKTVQCVIEMDQEEESGVAAS